MVGASLGQTAQQVYYVYLLPLYDPGIRPRIIDYGEDDYRGIMAGIMRRPRFRRNLRDIRQLKRGKLGVSLTPFWKNPERFGKEDTAE